MLKIKTFVFSPFAENTYLLWDDNSSETAIVDPGCLELHEEDKLLEFINTNNLSIKYLINTHCHIDHIFGNKFIKETFNVPFYAGKEDLFLLDKAIEQANMFGVKIKPSPEPDYFIDEDLVLKLGNIKLNFIFTPGHTPGEYCIYIENESVCITGDVLFQEGIGRTDLWGGDYDTLLNSIKSKLLTLHEDVVIYPGHGETSTIGHEKNHNSFLS